MQTLCDVFRRCHADHKPPIDKRWSQWDCLCIFCSMFSLQTAQSHLDMYILLLDMSHVAAPVLFTVGCNCWIRCLERVMCYSLLCVLTRGCVVCVQPPPSGPGVAGPSLPGGAPVPRFTPLLLQRREQAERVLTKSVSAIIIFCFRWATPLSAKNHLRHCLLFSLLFPRSFTLWALLFVIARLLTLTLSVLTFSFGLPRTENQGFSLAEGNFNVLTVRQVQTAISRTVLYVAGKYKHAANISSLN